MSSARAHDGAAPGVRLKRILTRRHLFVLGHMRSYSSLLSHILGSHPQIDGYCETHIKYRWHFDLLRLHRRVRELTGEPLSGDYVLDKVLHEYPLARGILDSPRTRGIVLVRRPKETLRSIIGMGLEYGSAAGRTAWHRDFELAARYYETRLAGLLRLTDVLRGRVAFVEAEALLSDTRSVLDRLGLFLELRSPLQSDYRRFAHTGEAGFGDPSRTIKTGRVTGEEGGNRPTVSVPRDLLARVQGAYEFWVAGIRKSCPVVIAGGSFDHDEERGCGTWQPV
jgi:hypothetical protein